MLNSYKVYVALDAEKKEGWVWLPFDAGLSAEYVTIRNPAKGLTAICERRIVDENFRGVYDSTEGTIHLPEHGQFIVMNAWYRQRLGIWDTRPELPLELKDASGWLPIYRASRQHPNPIIRLSTNLAVLSVLLGLAGLLEGAIALFK